MRFGLVLAAAATLAPLATDSWADPPRPRPQAPAARRAPQPARPSQGYQQAMTSVHAPTGHAAPVDAAGRPMLVFRNLGRNEKVEVSAASDRGGFSAYDLDRASHVLRASGGEEHPYDPRIIDIVYRIQAHFGAPEIRIVSGYRVPTSTGHSNHGKGRAIDFVLPGVSDAEIAKFARDIGFVGVGIYPTSKFVHVDIRPQSYFWVDYSGPGKKNRERGILGSLAAWSDQQAVRRGEKAIEPFVIETDVDAALRARALTAAMTPEEADEED